MEERDIVIIGAGPAGLSAAVFTQLDGWNTLVLESSWIGGQGAIAYTVSNYPGFPPGDGALLMENMEKQVTSAPPSGVGAELRMEKVIGLKAEDKVVITEKNEYRAQAIILAAGSRMQKLGAPGEERFFGKGVSYYARQDVEQFAGKRVLVVGGGNTTAKSALLAKTVASQVILIHRRESLRAYPTMTKKLQKGSVEVWYNTELKEIRGEDKVEVAVVENNKTGKETVVGVDHIIICVGTEPDTKLAQGAGLEMKGSFVKTDDRMMTSKQGIFACGEISGADRHLISCAASGASAGMAASEYLAMEMVRNEKMFEGAINAKYSDEYLAMPGL
jgi:thioredoxin reductase (NADPH)